MNTPAGGHLSSSKPSHTNPLDPLYTDSRGGVAPTNTLTKSVALRVYQTSYPMSTDRKSSSGKRAPQEGLGGPGRDSRSSPSPVLFPSHPHAPLFTELNRNCCGAYPALHTRFSVRMPQKDVLNLMADGANSVRKGDHTLFSGLLEFCASVAKIIGFQASS